MQRGTGYVGRDWARRRAVADCVIRWTSNLNVEGNTAGHRPGDAASAGLRTRKDGPTRNWRPMRPPKLPLSGKRLNAQEARIVYFIECALGIEYGK